MHNNYKLIQKKHNQMVTQIKSIGFIYHEIAKRMIDRLDYIKLTPHNILDIGSGLNIDAKNLDDKYQKANIFKLDIAINMLKQHNKQKGFLGNFLRKNAEYVCANAIELPIKSQSMDLVWSNLVLPYINNIEGYFKEIRRVLKLNACFLVTGLGVDSLQQLREVGLATYNFPDMHIIGDILVKLGFSNPVTDLEYINLEYTDIAQLITDIRIIGCGGILSRAIPLTKIEYLNIAQNFAKLTKNGKIPLTIELYYAHAWKDKVQLDLGEDEKIIQFRAKNKLD